MKPSRTLKHFSSFNKGKLSMQKLKDKATIDGHIDFINLLFPDQYGRMHALKVDAEQFIEEHAEIFEFN